MRRRHLLLAALALAGALSCADDSPAPGPKTPPDGTGQKGPYDDVPISGRVKIDKLKGPVDVVRDKYGMAHIRATSLEDALRVQGYQVARDRTAQLELIRRSATGRMAEILGDAAPSLIDSDIVMRNVGLARTAKEMLAKASPEIRGWVEAYADGISQFNARMRTGDEELPAGMLGLSQQAFQPWTPEDVVAVARLQAFNLGYDAEGDIAGSEYVANVRAKLPADSPDPKLQKRSRMIQDTLRFAPLENATPLADFPNDTQNTMSARSSRAQAPAKGTAVAFRASREALEATRAYRSALAEVRKLTGDKLLGTTGSNNWVVAPSRTANGHAMLASDPHLTLSAPPVFWMVHVTVDDPQADKKLDFAGLSFPGLPGIILGFNANVAWGATTADFDVTDVYEETLSADGNAVKFKGADVPIQKVRETIKIAGGKQLDYDVLVVPHHGPIVPNITADHTVAPPSGGKALSVKWTGHAATSDLDAIFGLLRAKNVDDARTSLGSFAVGAQNWVVADTSGNIFYTTHALIPKRDPNAFKWDPKEYKGTIPCLVLPGDGTAEWTGQFLEDAYIPHVKNPSNGYLATANTEQVRKGVDDNDPTNEKLPNGEPMYMGCWHDAGFRLARIQDRIEHVGHPMTLDDMASIQADARSASGAKLAPKLLEAIANAEKTVADPASHADLAALVKSPEYTSRVARIAEVKDLLTKWADVGYDAASGMTPDNTPSSDANEVLASRATTIFNAWFGQMFHRVFDDEAKLLGVNTAFDWRRVLIWLMTADPSQLQTFDATTNGTILFDDLGTPDVVETRDERAMTALLEALAFLEKRLGNDTNAWRWGRLHTIRFKALVGLWSSLSIPPVPDDKFPDGFPRHGDGYNVDVAAYGLPPALTPDAYDKVSFGYSHGPTQRFVIDMDPAGPIGRNALPGGNIWDSRSEHFRDEAERWRKNENRPVPFASKDVVGSAEGRVVYESTP